MKAKPESVAAIAAIASAQAPMVRPARKKSLAVRVLRAAQRPIAAVTRR
jgi:poly(3-hydroxybutyrate) depolymerase